jgi:hypothetical protein
MVETLHTQPSTLPQTNCYWKAACVRARLFSLLNLTMHACLHTSTICHPWKTRVRVVNVRDTDPDRSQSPKLRFRQTHWFKTPL